MSENDKPKNKEKDRLMTHLKEANTEVSKWPSSVKTILDQNDTEQEQTDEIYKILRSLESKNINIEQTREELAKVCVKQGMVDIIDGKKPSKRNKNYDEICLAYVKGWNHAVDRVADFFRGIDKVRGTK